jgi:glyoxylate reductase
VERSKKKKVYLTRKILEPAISLLSEKYEIYINEYERPPTKKELIKIVPDMDGILCTLSDKINKEVMRAAGPNLKVISSYSTGFDHIDVQEATKRGIYVTFTADILSEATADLTFSLILAIARKIVQADKYVREGLWKVGWMPDLFLGSDLCNKTLGILGLGKIGSAVACRAKGFKMNIIYHNRNSLNCKIETKLGARYVGIDNLMEESDFLSIHASLNKESFHLINKNKLKKMKSTAYIINTSRGDIINQSHLVYALVNKWIAGAALDTFSAEPLNRSNKLLKLENVILLPHIGSATYGTRTKMSEVAARNLINVLEGKDPIYLVNSKVKTSNR